MIAYFKDLFKYDRHATLLIIDAMLNAGTSGKAVVTMAHMLAAQQTWLKRCNHHPLPTGPLWPEDWPLEGLKAIVEQNHTEWMAYLDTLQDSDVGNIISYQNTKGMSFNDALRDILAHVINHGTHHRAQVGMMLKAAGIEPLPVTDYIFYVREQHMK